MSRNSPDSNNDSSDCFNADWGVLTNCFCGSAIFLETDCNPENFGVKYYRCLKTGDGRMHIEKYWDHAVDEELKKLESRLTEQVKSMKEMRFEIRFLKQQLLKKDNEINQIKAYLGIL